MINLAVGACDRYRGCNIDELILFIDIIVFFFAIIINIPMLRNVSKNLIENT